MKGGKQLRRINAGSDLEFNVRNIDILLTNCHILPEDIVSICLYEGRTYIYYLSES